MSEHKPIYITRDNKPDIRSNLRNSVSYELRRAGRELYSRFTHYQHYSEHTQDVE